MTRLAISNIAWDAADDTAVAALLAELGVDAIEVAPTRYWPAPCDPSAAELASCRDRWLEFGVQVVALQALLFGMPDLRVFGSAAEKDRLKAYLERIFRIAAALGAQYLVFGSPKNRDRGRLAHDQAVAEAIPFFRQLASAAADERVVLCIEPNPPQYQCNFLTTAEAAREFVQAVDHPNVALHLDAGILAINQEPVEATLDACLPVMRHFHISEPQLVAIGAGGAGHERIGRYLSRAGYCGHASIEMRAVADRSENLLQIRRSLALALQAYVAA